ncbi:MAG: glycosyltransferase [Nostoc sp. LLA-1]|nr:glycosyltransferase [Cyanocohniella sp. LLY]
MSGITVAYGGVHQIYQIALAAQEIGSLDKFFCSLIDAPGKYGNLISTLVGRDRFVNMRRPELNSSYIKEYPWPLLFELLRPKKVQLENCRRNVSEQFDTWVANKIRSLESKVFVGVETCAMHSFEVAQKQGVVTVLDCPQVHPKFLARVLNEASEDLQLCLTEPFDTPQTAYRKQLEFSMADHILVLSEVQKRSFIEAGFSPKQLTLTPLWSDTTLFKPSLIPFPKSPDRLKVLFVGAISLRKGIPYLLEAIKLCGTGIELTLLGAIMPEIEPYLAKYQDYFIYEPPTTKAELCHHYWQSDVLVLPSLVDAFGWVGMEAMTCGLPVIVSENCGVPVPDESWRVPIMNAEVIADKLIMLRDDREYCACLGEIAGQFSQQFTPQRYRQRLQILFKELLCSKV